MLGSHITFEKPMINMLYTVDSLQLDTFQFFIRNNRNMKRRSIAQSEITNFNKGLLLRGVDTYVIHAPYSMNLCTNGLEARERYIDILKEDLQFLQYLAGNKIYVIHPGSYMGQTVYDGLRNLVCCLTVVKDYIGNTTIAIETMAGAGTQALKNAQEVELLMCLGYDIPNLSICFDTCHVFASGNDIPETFDRLKQYVSVIHLNDSKGIFNSRLDRHMNIKSGTIPFEHFEKLVEINKNNSNVPIILETPNYAVMQDLLICRQNLMI